MTTIDDLACTIAEQHGIDNHDAAVDVVSVHVDQIADDPDLWDADAQTLTEAGVELVTGAVAESYDIGAISTIAQGLLDQIAEAEARRAVRTQLADKARQDRDQLVRTALCTELRRADIAAAGGLSKERLYQIRDRRR